MNESYMARNVIALSGFLDDRTIVVVVGVHGNERAAIDGNEGGMYSYYGTGSQGILSVDGAFD